MANQIILLLTLIYKCSNVVKWENYIVYFDINSLLNIEITYIKIAKK